MLITDGITLIAFATAAAGGVVDYRTGHIPNWLTLGSLAAAPLLWFGAVAASQGTVAGVNALATSLIGAVVCGLGPAFMFWRGGLGGGDVKLFTALGALLGFRLGLNVEMMSFVAMTLFFPGKLAWEGKLLRVLWGSLRMLGNPLRAPETRFAAPEELRMRLRLGPAIFVGTLAALVAAPRTFA
jgi:prepilin peptidase CpaA